MVRHSFQKPESIDRSKIDRSVQTTDRSIRGIDRCARAQVSELTHAQMVLVVLLSIMDAPDYNIST